MVHGILLIGFFVYALGLPKVSPAILIVLLFIVLHKTRLLLQNIFVNNVFLLLAFLSTYNLLMYMYGFMNLFDAIKFGIATMGGYVLGYYFVRYLFQSQKIYMITWYIVSLSFGYVVISFFTLKYTRSVLNVSNMEDIRFGLDIITGMKVNILHFIQLSGIGFALLPIFFVLIFMDVDKKQKYIFGLAIFFLFILAFFASFGIAQRTHYAIALSSWFVLLTHLLLFEQDIKTQKKIWIVSLVILAFVLILIIYINNEYFFHKYMLYRFYVKGFDSERFDNWLSILLNSIQYPMGGKMFNLPVSTWAHNYWLGILYETGYVPLLFVIIFHIRHVYYLFNFIKSNNDILIRYTILICYTYYTSNMFLQPVLHFNKFMFIFYFLSGILCSYHVFNTKAKHKLNIQSEASRTSSSYLSM